MSFVNYTDVGVKFDGNDVFAGSISANNSLSMSPVRGIGIQGSAGMVPDGPVTGEISIDMTGGAGGYVPKDDLSDADSCKVPVGLGTSTNDAYPTSFTVSMSPNEVVSMSFSGQTFGPLSLGGAGSGGGKEGAGGLFGGGHGASQYSSGAQTSAEYSFSASWDAIYFIGSLCPQFIFCTDGSIECSVEGPDITANVAMSCEDPCPTTEAVSFKVGSLCDGELGTYGCTGYATGGGLSVSEGGVLSGQRTVVQFIA